VTDPSPSATPLPATADGLPGRPRKTVIVSSLASDSHTWNLVFLQLLIEECGYDVVNLGPCVPDDLLLAQCLAHDPEMVVISSVNGHGYQDGMRVIELLRDREEFAETPVVIGGKLGTDGAEGVSRVLELTRAGFDAVFEDGQDPVTDFRTFLQTRPQAELPRAATLGISA
jgi:methylaspartate mutase sigma subunit